MAGVLQPGNTTGLHGSSVLKIVEKRKLPRTVPEAPSLPEGVT